MEINGTQLIPAPRAEVWRALNDTAVLKQCLPGCESVEKTGEGAYRLVMAVVIGPLRARFNGTLRMTEANPPQSCVMVFEGQGGAVGFGKGSTNVTLTETSAGTELTYSAQAQIGGKLAQVGSRLIDNVAKKMSDDFFAAFRKQLAPATAAEAPAGPAVRAASGSASTAGTEPAQAFNGNNGTGGGTKAPVVVPQAEAARAAAATATPPRAAPSAAAAANGPFVVPGWWLGVAMLLGVFASFAGAHWMH
ncbi:CoxG family protein [Burkholderia sp. PAMC 26561]|uniref:CoxG family protein n=1 Tax=Burkholderia sp. PAMC 26561 TaxID=1795043 RepID=UPI00084CF56D|nr:carbon monoxide dehydrogenase subunit G [Burkholderia sp. PAMC 26561]